MKKNTPDWDYWSKLPEVRVFEALALLEDQAPDEGPPDDDEADEQYRKRLRLLTTAMYDRGQFSPATLSMVSPALHGVRLPEVRSWAESQGWSVPERFPRKPSRPPVKWPLWLHMPQVKLWEAVALVLGIEPTSLRHHPEGWMAGPGRGPVFTSDSFPSKDKAAQYDDAMLLAERAANVSGPIHLTTGLASGMNKRTAMVSLTEVAGFFASCGWAEIPTELLEVKPVAEGKAEKAEQRQDRRYARFHELGGKLVRVTGAWNVDTKQGQRGALSKLVEEEKTAGRPRSDRKDVSSDLAAAAERLREGKA